jgi:hypothetical protein
VRGRERRGVADLEVVEEVVADERGEAAGAEVRHDGRQAQADGKVAGAADELPGEGAEAGPRVEGPVGGVQLHRLAAAAERGRGGGAARGKAPKSKGGKGTAPKPGEKIAQYICGPCGGNSNSCPADCWLEVATPPASRCHSGTTQQVDNTQQPTTN